MNLEVLTRTWAVGAYLAWHTRREEHQHTRIIKRLKYQRVKAGKDIQLRWRGVARFLLSEGARADIDLYRQS